MRQWGEGVAKFLSSFSYTVSLRPPFAFFLSLFLLASAASPYSSPPPHSSSFLRSASIPPSSYPIERPRPIKKVERPSREI